MIKKQKYPYIEEKVFNDKTKYRIVIKKNEYYKVFEKIGTSVGYEVICWVVYKPILIEQFFNITYNCKKEKTINHIKQFIDKNITKKNIKPKINIIDV